MKGRNMRYEVSRMALCVGLAVAWVYALGQWVAASIIYGSKGWSIWPFLLAAGLTTLVWAAGRSDEKKDG
jgi:hypothetical protein